MVIYLETTGAREEAFIREIELFDAERACFVFVVVDDLILMWARHDG